MHSKIPADSPIGALDRRRWLLYAAFLTIILGFLAINSAAMLEMRGVYAHSQDVSANAMVSVEQVTRIVHDLDEKRLLIGEHIFEKQQVDMQRLERRMANVEADLTAAMAAYDPLATFENEREDWKALQAELTALGPPIEHVLALSRTNRDSEARAELGALDGRFDDINRRAERLIRLNQRESEQSLSRIHSLQRRSMAVIGGITLAGSAVALLLAAWVLRAIRRGDVKLQQGAQQLETRNRELDAFAGRVAHDLRTPLTTIGISAERLSRRAPDQKETSEVLRRGVSHMSALIRDLLLLSRIDELGEAAADVAAVVAGVGESLGVRVRATGGMMRVDVEAARVRGTGTLLHEAIANLCENAIKYRRPGVPLVLELRGRACREGYELRVGDNGRGMTPNEARHAFEPFFRGEGARDTAGTGLGLSIVKRVIDATGGAISVESQLGRGTTFVIRLPCAGEPKLRHDERGARHVS